MIGSALLHEFVDRASEVREFCELLATGNPAIVGIWGAGGIGKSALLARLVQECEAKSARAVAIEWRDSRRYSYLDLMRRIRDLTQPEMFGHFNDRVNFYTVPEYRLRLQLDVGSIENVQITTGNVANGTVNVNVGHRVDIKDLMLNVLRPDRVASDDTICIELTTVFFECLREFTSSTKTVLLFDALEKADLRTRDWLAGELLIRLRDGELPNTLVILAGRDPIDLDVSFSPALRLFELSGLGAQHISEYLERKGLPDGGLLAAFLSQQFQGNPLQISSAVNGFLRSHARGAANA